MTGRLDTLIDRLAADIAEVSGQLGAEVRIDKARVLDRSDSMDLAAPGEWSANRSCWLLPAADGWIAVNLPRPADHWLVPAWIGSDLEADTWTAIEAAARLRPRAELLAQAHLLGLAVAAVGEVDAMAAAVHVHALGVAVPRTAALRVVDLSTLWAGPLCGSVFAAMGAAVLKVESRSRADVGRQSAPRLFERLNGQKAQVFIDFDDPTQLRRLTAQIAAADVLITSARPRAFEHWQLSPSVLFALNPRLVWVAITAYGWTGASAQRIGFGDDAAAAGGLLHWNAAGEPRFLGDALADPLTGLEAARAALHTLAAGGGALLDVALARTAAAAAAV